MQIAVDRLSPSELNSLDLIELGHAMNEIISEVAQCGRLRSKVLDNLSEAKKAKLRATTHDDRRDAEILVIEFTTQLRKLINRLAELRQQSSLIQTQAKIQNVA